MLAPPVKFAGVSDSPTKVVDPPPPELSSAISHLLDVLLYFIILSLAIPVRSTSVNAASVVAVDTPVRFEPSTAGNLPVPSSCTILFAPVPTSTFNVAEPDVAPPVNPVPATTAVISPTPPPFAGAHLLLALSQASTCPSVGAALCTFVKSANTPGIVGLFEKLV